MTDTAGRSAPNLVLLNYLGAGTAALLTALGALAREFGGLLMSVPAMLLVLTAGPVAVAFLLAAEWWRRRWPHARLVQSIPVLIILGWAALIFLSPVQPRPPGP